MFLNGIHFTGAVFSSAMLRLSVSFRKFHGQRLAGTLMYVTLPGSG
jgi:hypothetical protein